MPTVACPSCGEKGKIPGHFVGTRIKCKKCGNAFLVTPPGAKPEAPAPAASPAAAAARSGAVRDANVIEVEGLDDAEWSSSSVAAVEQDHETEHAHDESSGAFTATHHEAGVKQYKILTPKDKFFDGKFDIDRLEQALNILARQGWVVKGMATPHIAGFSGGEREQLIVLLERG